MPDKINNINPSQQNNSALASILTTGLHAPSPIIFNSVSYNLEEVKVSIEAKKENELPVEAKDTLYSIASDIINNQNVILVDDQVRICNMLPSANPEGDFTIVQAFAAAGVDTDALGAALPNSIDLRENWWRVKDQGPTGACAGFSASSLMEYVFTKTKRLNAGETLSPRSIWMSAKETDTFTNMPSTFIELEGTSLTATLGVIQRWGCVRESFMPFNQLYTKSAQSYYLSSASFRLLSYFNLGKSIDSWKKWLSQYGPIYAAITVDESWQNATSTQGVVDRYNSSRIYGGHAVVICGFDETKQRILFKNSWGNSWGDGGYAWASYAWCMQAVLETYGIAV